MSQDWAEKVAQQLLSRGLIQTGTCLILGAADTGKTTLATAMAKHAASSRPVGIIDADIGQSHIGPPATVGWAIVDSPQINFSKLPVGGISFVGDVTPVGHLLQLTAAITQCVQQASKVAELIIVDTPGFIRGPAASTLWWTVQRILKPKLILAVQRSDELSGILAGLKSAELQLEPVKSPSEIPTKSPQDRQSYRQGQFNKYFRDSCLYNISLRDVAIQPGRNLSRESLIHQLVALRDEKGTDIAIGLITNGHNDGDIMAVRAPKIENQGIRLSSAEVQIRCLVIGDIAIDISGDPKRNKGRLGTPGE